MTGCVIFMLAEKFFLSVSVIGLLLLRNTLAVQYRNPARLSSNALPVHHAELPRTKLYWFWQFQ